VTGVETNQGPAHVGLIPDGTRRWATATAVPLQSAYDAAFEKVAACTARLFELGVRSVSLYFSSRENLGRPAHELDAVLRAEAAVMRGALEHVAVEHRARVVVAGHLDRLPEWFVDPLRHLVRMTAAVDDRRIYLCIAYNPWEELDAALDDGRPGVGLPERMWVPESLDLVIRTSGVTRLSNFLPLQAAYANFAFVDASINEMDTARIDQEVNRYRLSERRRGT
jgi:undecaprenyl pyrophosphate synthase